MYNKLSTLAGASICAVALTSAASAGSLRDPIVEPPLTSAVETNWQGFRLGLTYNTEIDSLTRVLSEGVPFINGPNQGFDDLGGFVGFDFQRGNVVFGVELQAMPQQNRVQGFPNRIHRDTHSLRARLGYSTGKALFYGSFGLAQSEFENSGTIIDMDGQVFGLGAEMKVSKSAFVGLSVDHYDLSGENIARASNVESNYTVVQLRIGFKF